MFNSNEKYPRKIVAEKFENKIFEDNRLGNGISLVVIMII